MNKAKSEDSPSRATTVGQVVSSLLPMLLLSLGWPGVIACASDSLFKSGSRIEGGGDVGDLMTLTWNTLIGIFISIQLITNIFRHFEGKRYRRGAGQFALTLFLTLLSVFCIVGTIFFNCDIFTAISRDDSHHKIWDLLVILVILAPVVAWFWFNLMRLVKKPHYV